jgi:hypothetical protein
MLTQLSVILAACAKGYGGLMLCDEVLIREAVAMHFVISFASLSAGSPLRSIFCVREICLAPITTR